jgi:hypothetical protein
MNKGTITYHFSDNLGDYIQTLAAEQLLGTGPFEHCDREQLHTYSGDGVALLTNGWFMAHPTHWPPASKIHPLLISMHINPTAEAQMLNAAGVNYLKTHGPVGCRDFHTLNVLKEKGVPAYFSGCLTLTLKRSDWVPKGTPRNGILVLSALDRLLPNLNTLWKEKNYKQWLLQLLKFPRKRKRAQKAQKALMHFLEQQQQPITYASQIVERPFSSNSAYFTAARQQLEKIATAAVVITSRIHTALPAVALGTPVVFLVDGLQHPNQMSRLEGLTHLFTVCTSSELATLSLEHLKATEKHLPIAKKIEAKVAAFFKQ